MCKPVLLLCAIHIIVAQKCIKNAFISHMVSHADIYLHSVLDGHCSVF